MSAENSDSSGRQLVHRGSEIAQGTLPQYLHGRRQIIDAGISAFINRHYEGEILDVVRYATERGKRLRGILAILICEALGGSMGDALPAAVAVELAHAASLAHDDLMDADAQRRGRPSLHVRYGTAIAVLIPHMVVPHAILSAQVYGPQAISTIVEGWACVVGGQVRDYLTPDLYPCATNADGDYARQFGSGGSLEGEYLQIVHDKTSALFETAAVLGAMAAHDLECTLLARAYAGQLGTAFQIADDISDLLASLQQPWSALFGSGSRRAGRGMYVLREIVAREEDEVITVDAVARAKQLVSESVDLSQEHAAKFPCSPLRALLFDFAAVAVDQIYAEAPYPDRQSQHIECNQASDER